MDLYYKANANAALRYRSSSCLPAKPLLPLKPFHIDVLELLLQMPFVLLLLENPDVPVDTFMVVLSTLNDIHFQSLREHLQCSLVECLLLFLEGR